MKRRITLQSIRFLLSMAFVLSVSDGLAQYERRGGASTAAPQDQRLPVAIKDLLGTGRRDVVGTPLYTTSYGRGNNAAKEWGIVRVEYATSPEWIDEMMISFYALSLDADTREKKYTFYQRDVRYMDVEQGRTHLAAVYVRPSALLRFGQIVAVAVEFSIEGKIVATKSESTMGKNLPEDWWKNPLVVKSELVDKREGYMLNRAESPFAYVAIDDYEAIK